MQDSASFVYNSGTNNILYGDSVNWMNFDGVFPGGGSYYQITANTVGCPDVTNTNVYVFVNGYHAVWSLNGSGASQFQTPTDIVAGVPVTIVGYCVSGGKFYSAFMPVTASSNQTITLNFTQTTDVAFKAAVTALN